MPPQNVPLRHIGYFELQALENQQILRQPASELPYLPEDRYSRRTSGIIKTLPGSFINQI